MINFFDGLKDARPNGYLESIKTRLFYTQGDYGLWQCRSGRVKKTYDNEVPVKKMLLALLQMIIPIVPWFLI